MKDVKSKSVRSELRSYVLQGIPMIGLALVAWLSIPDTWSIWFVELSKEQAASAAMLVGFIPGSRYRAKDNKTFGPR